MEEKLNLEQMDPSPFGNKIGKIRILMVPMHPGHQYHFCRVGLPIYFLGNWNQFQYWRPRPQNVFDLLPNYDPAQVNLGPKEYGEILDRMGSPLKAEFDLAWLIFGWQYELFRTKDIPIIYHATKTDEVKDSVWAEMIERDDVVLVSFYPNTVEWIKQRFGVDIPYVPIGLNPEDYAGYTGHQGTILSVIHSWSSRGWHYVMYREACHDLPTLHIDHYDQSRVVYQYEDLLEAFRASRVYLHDGEQEYTIALIEALMAGMPIVSFKLPGIERYVRNGVNGFVGRNAVEIREYCRMLLDDDELATSMGMASRRIALRDYNEERWRTDWIRIISEFLKIHR